MAGQSTKDYLRRIEQQFGATVAMFAAENVIAVALSEYERLAGPIAAAERCYRAGDGIVERKPAKSFAFPRRA